MELTLLMCFRKCKLFIVT